MQNKLSGLSLIFKWSQVKPLPGKLLPRSRSRHSSCLHDDCVYLIGGKDGRVSLKDIWKFHLGTGEWVKLTLKGDTLSYLEGHTLISYKKNLLLFGGSFGDDVTDSALWIINPDVLHVRQVACEPGFPQPSRRRHHSAVVYEGVMYVYGGHLDLRGSSSDFWAFHISEEEWEMIKPRQNKSDMPEGRHGHSAVLYGRDMWIYGGLSDLTPKSDLWYYNFHVGKWTRMKSRFGPPALVGHSAAVVKDNMILQGGEQNGELRNDFWIFSFGSLKWTHVEIPNQVPSPRMWHSMESVTIATKKTEGSVRTSSMPYLQNKQGRRQHLRPRSSPAYSSARNRVTPRVVNRHSASDSGNVRKKPGDVELKPIKCQTESLPVVMRTPTPPKKEEKSPLLLERHLSRCSDGSQTSLKGTDNLGMDMTGSSDDVVRLDVASCREFSESYGYHQKPVEQVKSVKMQTFNHNVINVLPYRELAQELVVEDLEIYENYFSQLSESSFVKSECQRNRFVGPNKKYKVNKVEMNNLSKSTSSGDYGEQEGTLDRCRSSSVGELSKANVKVSEQQTKLRSYSLHNLKKDSPVLCWQSENSSDKDDDGPTAHRDMETTSFSEPVKMDIPQENKTVTQTKMHPTKRHRERGVENQDLAQPYLLLFGGKDMRGGSVRLESLTVWRCDVFLRHSDISHGEFHKSSLIV